MTTQFAQPAVREVRLNKLSRTVFDAATYLRSTDENLYDGQQSAHATLAQFVFWHKQYIEIIQALIEGREPTLLPGSFAQINQRARRENAVSGMGMLAHELSGAQRKLAELLMQVPDWSAAFPIKRDSDMVSIADRLVEIEAHISRHITRLKLAEGQPVAAPV